MEYRLPTLEDEKILREYVEEHYAFGHRSISACLGMTGMPFKDWVELVRKNATEATDEWGKYYLYLIFDGERLVGLLNIRFDFSKEMADKYGHIGYGIRPTERRKGYATKALQYAIDVCREKGLKEIFLGCYADNIPSRKTIEGTGAELIRTETEEQKISDDWTINLKDYFYRLKL